MADVLVVDSRVSIPESDLSWTAVRASGPGGQNVNKVSSKVELRFDLRGSTAIDEVTRRKLFVLAGSRVDADGQLLLVSQATRDQRRNLEDARAKLVELVQRALVRETPRRATKPSRGAKERRLTEKKRVGEKKRGRGARGDD